MLTPPPEHRKGQSAGGCAATVSLFWTPEPPAAATACRAQEPKPPSPFSAIKEPPPASPNRWSHDAAVSDSRNRSRCQSTGTTERWSHGRPRLGGGKDSLRHSHREFTRAFLAAPPGAETQQKMWSTLKKERCSLAAGAAILEGSSSIGGFYLYRAGGVACEFGGCGVEAKAYRWCRDPTGYQYCTFKEQNVLFPCKYASSGCEITLPHTEKADHEELCEFRPYSCPCPGASCKWQGSLDAVMPHLMHQHKSITTLQGEDIVFLATDINLPGAVDWVMMQSCFGFHFMLVLEKQEKYDGHQQFFAIVQLIGTCKQAENFAYRLELNGHRQRMTWEATPRSIHEGIATAIMNSDCLVFDTSIAQLFAENGNLGINVTISMC
ncbi:E3 ubiquitin-protein ligase SIAH1-like [Urocitellus parryii]